MPPGVRGLAAMFEQRGDTSPDDLARGRSPNGFPGTPPPSDSPRPLSKIRTQFVAVEKDGRLGLTRGISADSVANTSRAPSNETSTTTPQPRSEPTSDPFTETAAAALRKITSNPVSTPNATPRSRPESPQKLALPFGRMSPLKPAALSTPEIMPNANPDKATDEEETKTKLQPGLPTEQAATRAPDAVVSNGIGDNLTSAAATAPAPKPDAVPVTAKAEAPVKTKPAPVSTAKTASKAPKSPLPVKTPKSPLPPKASKSPTKDTLKPPTLAPAKKTSSTNLKDSAKKTTTPPAATTPVPAPATSTSKKPAAIELPRSGSTGFVKPKAKSPTRPVKVPTASSSTRTTTTTAPPVTKQPAPAKRSRSLAPTESSRRPASRISAAGGSDAPRKLRRQSSSINGGRQSIGHIGPPPKPKDQAAPKKDYHVDESFLARMMRPTQSSASKTTDKAPVTPPRKTASSKAPAKHVTGADVSASAKKVAARIQASGSTKPKVNDTRSTKSVSPTTPPAERAASKKAATEVIKTKRAAQLAAELSAPIKVSTADLEQKMDGLAIDGQSSKSANIGEKPEDAQQTVDQASQVIIGSAEHEQSSTVEPKLVVAEEPLKVEDIEDVAHEPETLPAAEKVDEPEVAAAPTMPAQEISNATPSAATSEVKADSEVKEETKEAGPADVTV